MEIEGFEEEEAVEGFTNNNNSNLTIINLKNSLMFLFNEDEVDKSILPHPKNRKFKRKT